MIENHYGYGLRNDEKPFAHKIPPGGYWRDLPMDEIMIYWNGVYPRSGGCTNGLRRKAWDEPAGAITTNPFQKLSCQLHPDGGSSERVGEPEMVYNVIPQLEPNGLTITELFAGGGLMAAGLTAAGYDILWANDFDKHACTAYRHNYGHHIVQGDITAIDPDSIPNTDIIAGGPPCQDYSVAGMGAGEEGERGKLVWTYLSIIERKQPKAFIFENVKGLVQKAHLHTFTALLDAFAGIGYKISHKVVNAWDHGVAQKRERVFIVGIREDLGFRFMFPDPIPEDCRTQILRDVIGDLPEPGMIPKSQKAREGDTLPGNHAPRELSEQAITYLHSKDGRSLKKHRPPTMEEPSQTIVSNVARGVPYGLYYPDKPENHDPQELSEKALDYVDRNWEHRGSRVKDMDEPGSTVSAVYAKGVPYGLFYPEDQLPNHERKDISDKALEGYERRGGNGGFAYRVNEWDEPSPTIFGRIFNEGKAFVHPSANEKQPFWGMSETEPMIPLPENHEGALFDNVNFDWNYDKSNRQYEWDKPSATIGTKHRCEGIHPDHIENHDRWKKLTTDDERLPQLPESISTVGSAKILGDIYMQNYAKAGNDEPALTVAAIGYPKPHPKKPRRFTVRECLRIQSVPDWYVLPDSISLSAQYRIVGNGVASRVAYLLGIALADQLKVSGNGTDDGQVDLFELIEEPNRRIPRERQRKPMEDAQ